MLYPVFLLYGFVFVGVGIALASQAFSWPYALLSRRATLTLAAASGLHGLNELAVMARVVEQNEGHFRTGILLGDICLFLLSIAFMGFGMFGIEALISLRRLPRWTRVLPLLVLALVWLKLAVTSAAAGHAAWHADRQGFNTVRHALGLPGACVAAFGLLRVSQAASKIEDAALRRGTRNAAFAFVAYATISGAFTEDTFEHVLRISGSPFRAVFGAALGWFLVKALVIQAASERARWAQMREEFIGVIAHDLRNPISTLAMSAEVVRKLPHARAQSLAELILRNTSALARLVGDLLDASRVESRNVELRKSWTSLPALVADAVVQSAAEREHVVHVDVGNLPSVEVDPDRILQVLVNLLSNASKYSPAGSTISVGLEAIRSKVFVSITNVGAIAREDAAKLFTRYFRTRSARDSAVDGTGLGLYIVRGLVEAHGGTIEAESKHDGHVVFRFWLPSVSNIGLSAGSSRAAMNEA
ncbi:MAG: hypothetical protein JWO86_9066 [Myxococcaceae bacterium]|nr:hypothetical protein [Myxococcaceae bacterium]MEA2746691.1 hypothetical protein [Myxococcales bacterium]